MGEYLELAGGGALTLRRDGPRLRLEARRPDDGRGLYKVWLRGAHGGSLLLGTLAPEGDCLSLRRTLSVSELERAGCWPDLRAEAVLTFPFSPQPSPWYCEPHPERLMSDPVLQQAVPGPLLCRKGPEGFSLAAPFLPGRPFPLPPLFCLTRVERWPDGPHLVWQFDRRGAPSMPPRPAPPP